MLRPVPRLLDPFFRLWSPIYLLRAGIASRELPLPTDAPKVHISGPDPDRILVVGGGIAAGLGVLSYELSIAGHLSRQVAGATGRGMDTDIIAESGLRLDEVTGRVRDVNLSGYDAVVLFIGVADSIRHTPARSWHRNLSALLEDFSDRIAAGTRILVVGIQSARLVLTLDNRAGFFAERHARTLERETIRVCAAVPNASYVPFQPRHEKSERYRSSAIYQRWAALVSPQVVDVLEANHPLGDATS